MAGAALEIRVDAAAAAGIEARIRKLRAGLGDTEPLMAGLAAELESQARRRIDSGGPAPDGTPWKPWAENYAKTRRDGQSQLRAEGALLDSLEAFSDADRAGAGTNLIYGPIQQFGGEEGMAPGPAAIPGRPYLGIGPQDELELQAVIDRWLSDAAAGALA